MELRLERGTIAEKKLAAFRVEMRNRKIQFSVGFVFLFFVSVFLVCLLKAPEQNPLYTLFGIKTLGGVAEGGVYADCSGKHGSINPLCREKVNSSSREWRRLQDSNKKPIPFNLY